MQYLRIEGYEFGDQYNYNSLILNSFDGKVKTGIEPARLPPNLGIAFSTQQEVGK